MEHYMNEYINVLKNGVLFKDIAASDLEGILKCLNVKVSRYEKNETIILLGDPVDFVGVVVSGSIMIMKEDINGNVNIIAKLGTNEVFAEAFACANIKESPVTVQALEDCEIVFLDVKRIIMTCSQACDFHKILIGNLLWLVARKSIILNQKIEIMSKRALREKLLTFFNIQIRMAHSKRFVIPYNREALSQYLCVDRSAMSRELCKMRDEGIIKFKKNEFEFLR
jgi:CRP/FNR family transcriptional regulator, dissimilatory nitrate respiration regulator